MKKLLFPFCALLLFPCCGKLSVNDIVQTDKNGNITNRGNSSDWVVSNTNANKENKYTLESIQRYLDSRYQQFGLPSMAIHDGCKIPDTLEIIAYPNPVKNVDDLRVKIKSSKPVCHFSFSYIGLNGNGGGSATGSADYFPGLCKTNLDVGLAGNINFPTTDMELNFIVVTADSCVYYTKGNVKVVN